MSLFLNFIVTATMLLLVVQNSGIIPKEETLYCLWLWGLESKFLICKPLQMFTERRWLWLTPGKSSQEVTRIWPLFAIKMRPNFLDWVLPHGKGSHFVLTHLERYFFSFPTAVFSLRFPRIWTQLLFSSHFLCPPLMFPRSAGEMKYCSDLFNSPDFLQSWKFNTTAGV